MCSDQQSGVGTTREIPAAASSGCEKIPGGQTAFAGDVRPVEAAIAEDDATDWRKAYADLWRDYGKVLREKSGLEVTLSRLVDAAAIEAEIPRLKALCGKEIEVSVSLSSDDTPLFSIYDHSGQDFYGSGPTFEAARLEFLEDVTKAKAKA